jgi:hypothetical protein
MREDRLTRLARSLDQIPARDRQRIRQAEDLEQLRRQGARQIYELCQSFVSSLNQLLTQLRLELTPDDYQPLLLHSPAHNLFQINASGRVLQISFAAAAENVSTDNFRTPYILEGAVRWYNQEILEHPIFYCLDKTGNAWRYFDARKHRSGAVDEEYLTQILEQLI